MRVSLCLFSLHEPQAIERSYSSLDHRRKSGARASTSVAEHECYVVVKGARVTTIHIHSYFQNHGHGDVSFFRTRCDVNWDLLTAVMREAIAKAKRNQRENDEVLKARGDKTRPDTSCQTKARSPLDVPRRSKA